jgi:HPt (histidine-containing phosphotransfer) domain-containing protein
MAEKIYCEVLAAAPFLRQAVLKFLALLPERVRQFDAALRAGNFEELRMLAHRIKGAGGTHGYPGVTECAQALEKAARALDGAQAEGLIRQFSELIERLVPEPPPG